MEVESFKHVCKFCKKSFPCGRSLGGHIRSHLPKPGYELRENPKKTWRAVDHVDDMLNNSSYSSSIQPENPKTCSKMNQIQGKRSKFTRSNSRSSVSEEVEEEKQEVVVAMCLIMLSQDVGSWGDNISSTGGKNSKSINKIREKVQGKYSAFGAVNGKKSEYATNGYLPKEPKSKVIEVSANGLSSNEGNSKNIDSKRKGKLHGKDYVSCGKITKVETMSSGVVKDGAKSEEFEDLETGFVANDQNKKTSESKRKIGQITASGYVKKGSNFEEFEALKDGFVSCDQDHNDMDIELYNNVSKASFYKRSKFECTTCNKVFHSYQALGGHRASHKRLVGAGSRCSPPLSKDKLEEKDIASFDVPLSPDDRKDLQSKQEQEQELMPEMRFGSSSSTTSSKKVVQKHECPICFRVFPSGQALGGHKRSHLLVAPNADITGKVSEVKNSNNQSNKFGEVVERSSSTETKDLLDLNFPPAPVQDETTTSLTTTSSTSNSLVGFMKPYWFVESSHKHGPLLGLISN